MYDSSYMRFEQKKREKMHVRIVIHAFREKEHEKLHVQIIVHAFRGKESEKMHVQIIVHAFFGVKKRPCQRYVTWHQVGLVVIVVVFAGVTWLWLDVREWRGYSMMPEVVVDKWWMEVVSCGALCDVRSSGDVAPMPRHWFTVQARW